MAADPDGGPSVDPEPDDDPLAVSVGDDLADTEHEPAPFTMPNETLQAEEPAGQEPAGVLNSQPIPPQREQR
jgi:hypothetical protein